MLASNARRRSMSLCSTSGRPGSTFCPPQLQWRGLYPSRTTVTLSSIVTRRFVGTCVICNARAQPNLDHHRALQMICSNLRGRSRRCGSCGGGCTIPREEQSVGSRYQEGRLPIGGAQPRSCSHFPIPLPAIHLKIEDVRTILAMRWTSTLWFCKAYCQKQKLTNQKVLPKLWLPNWINGSFCSCFAYKSIFNQVIYTTLVKVDSSIKYWESNNDVKIWWFMNQGFNYEMIMDLTPSR